MKRVILLSALVLSVFAAAAWAIEVAALKIGTDIDAPARAIIGEAESFPAGTAKVCAFVDLRNISAGESDKKDVTFKWYLGEENTDSITKSPYGWRWRTWTCKTNLVPGSWKVDIVEAATGTVLSTKTFTIAAAAN